MPTYKHLCLVRDSGLGFRFWILGFTVSFLGFRVLALGLMF